MATYQQIGPKYCPKCKAERKKKVCEICGEKTKPSGNWSVIFDLPTNGEKRYQKRLGGFASRNDAELAYIAFKSTYKPPNPYTAQGDSFGAVFVRYLMYQEPRVKESTYVDTKRTFERHLLPFFKDFEFQKIQPKDIIAWQGWMNEKDLSFKYKDCALTHLKGFFNYCVDIEGSISESPAKKQIKFINTEVKNEMLFYSPEEYLQFRSVIDDRRDLILFDLLYFTGMRKGELLALLWSDFKSDSIRITKTYTRKTKNGKWKITSPKSKNSVRENLLPATIINALTEYKSEIKAKETDYIIGCEWPLNERYIDMARDKYYKASGMKRIRIHDFRHSHVSYLISENVDVVTVAKRIGDTVETILKTYAHMLPNKQSEMVVKLENLLKPTVNQKVCD